MEEPGSGVSRVVALSALVGVLESSHIEAWNSASDDTSGPVEESSVSVWSSGVDKHLWVSKSASVDDGVVVVVSVDNVVVGAGWESLTEDGLSALSVSIASLESLVVVSGGVSVLEVVLGRDLNVLSSASSSREDLGGASLSWASSGESLGDSGDLVPGSGISVLVEVADSLWDIVGGASSVEAESHEGSLGSGDHFGK